VTGRFESNAEATGTLARADGQFVRFSGAIDAVTTRQAGCGSGRFAGMSSSPPALDATRSPPVGAADGDDDGSSGLLPTPTPSKLAPPLTYPSLFRTPPPAEGDGRGQDAASAAAIALSHLDVNPAFVVLHPGRHSHGGSGGGGSGGGLWSDLLAWRRGGSGRGASSSGLISASAGAAAAATTTSVHLTPLPEVTMRDFQPYLATLRQAQQRAGLRDEQVAISASDWASFARMRPLDARAYDHLPEHVRPRGSAATGGSGAFGDDDDRAAPTTPPSVLVSPRTGTVMTALDAFTTVPAQFFQPAFSLRAPGVLHDLITAGPLQETENRLTNNLDTVECQLMFLLRSRSRQLFDALHTLQQLRDALTEANVTTAALQHRVRTLRREEGVRPLLVIARTRRKQRKLAVLDRLSALREVTAAVATIGAAIGRGDLMGALTLLRSARHALVAKLTGIRAAVGLARQLDGFDRLIAETLVANFSTTAVTLAIVGPPWGEDAGAVASAAAGGSDAGELPTSSLSDFLAGSAPSVAPLRANGHAHDHGRAATRVDVMLDAFVAATGGGGGTAAAQATALEAALNVQVRPLLEGLIAVDKLAPALDMLQAGLLKEVKHVVAGEVAEAVSAAEVGALSPEAMSHHGGSAGTGAAAPTEVTPERLASLAPAAFHAVFASLSASLCAMWRRVHALHDAVQQALDTTLPARLEAAAGGSGAPATSAAAEWKSEERRLRAASAGMVAAVVAACHQHGAKLLSMRREQSARVRLREIRALWDAAVQFAATGHAILSRIGAAGPAMSLPATATSSLSTDIAATPVVAECLLHVRGMLAHSHARNSELLHAMLESEQWREAVVPPPMQAIADAMTASVAHGTSSNVLQSAVAAMEGLLPSHAAEDDHGGGEGAQVKVLRVGATPYHTVVTGVMLVKVLGDYASLAEAIPEVSADLVGCTVEVLRMFNTRTSDLVLHAGALKSAHLKRITAKHLALALQSVSMVLALLPPLRSGFIMRLPPAQHPLLQELAAVTVDYMKHERQVLAKFVAMVKDVLAKCGDDMAALPWGVAEPPMPIPTPPMREIVKSAQALHKILAPVLRPDQLATVMEQIAATVGGNLRVPYTAILNTLGPAPPTPHSATSATPLPPPAVEDDAAAAAPPSSAEAVPATVPLAAPTLTPQQLKARLGRQQLAADLSVLINALHALLDATDAVVSTAASAVAGGDSAGVGAGLAAPDGGLDADGDGVGGDGSSGGSGGVQGGRHAVAALLVWARSHLGESEHLGGAGAT